MVKTVVVCGIVEVIGNVVVIFVVVGVVFMVVVVGTKMY